MASVSEPYLEGLQLSPNDFREVYAALFEKRSRWRSIGIALGFIPSELNNIEAQYEHLDRRLQEMLSKWLNSSKLSPSWTSLVAALRSKTVEEMCLAHDIEQDHILAPKRPRPVFTEICVIPSPAPATPGSPAPVANAFAHKPWFHSGISQDEAAKRLRESTHENCFLVRESQSKQNPSCYSLSVKFEGKIQFFQLFWDSHRHTFEILGCSVIFGSPLELIEHYKTAPLTTGGVTLGVPLHKQPASTTGGVTPGVPLHEPPASTTGGVTLGVPLHKPAKSTTYDRKSNVHRVHCRIV